MKPQTALATLVGALALLYGALGQVILGLSQNDLQQPLLHHHNKGPHYEVLTHYFKQDDPTTDDATFDVSQDFGLYPNTTWTELVAELQALNAQHPHRKYKLLFLQRHGEGWHNVAPADYPSDQWACYWQVLNGNSTVEWYDAELTPSGVQQLTSFQQAWASRVASDGVPIPQSYYVSPLRRTLQTWEILWSKLATTRPVIKELARETYGIGTESKRHNKEYLQRNYGFADFEAGFSQFDDRWVPDRHESSQHRKYRAQQLLNDIFLHDPSVVVSVVSHSGLIKSVLKVVHHRKWGLQTGQMVPVVVEARYNKKGDTYDLDKPWSEYRSCETS
ncbi:phosphoglycerate mutase-like protein [Suhomyces tanzawaensis NRRL Y-17324]|uniref:Phosphoglycerate mutase-like protein n=1 Tax=Suhomyces tanzawaensis NRRL Y-17324 TaxID=984487 RepID=A0A1E4SJ98_9ASCO|nr:phosphoglycerate mutase-like protein [Suhomyces tanzawaensis NRRL Y-17324]ODV79586.1 phosphoglycerate mutase-like protein [Suhomyces tanzawaensis NRRL Y-17324]